VKAVALPIRCYSDPAMAGALYETTLLYQLPGCPERIPDETAILNFLRLMDATNWRQVRAKVDHPIRVKPLK
jgi:hypothetical protein